MPEQCEYDEAPLVRDSEGREDVCPTCATDVAAHRNKCALCRLAGDPPDDVTGEKE